MHAYRFAFALYMTQLLVMLARVSVSLMLAAFLGMAPSSASTEDGASGATPLMLANSYHSNVDLSAYWVSEKYDGIRAYWDGEQFFTRGGERIHAPAWFTAGWPQLALDGELWAGRGRFAEAVSTARRQKPEDAAWRNMHFMVFDLPLHGGVFDERLPALQTVIAQLDVPWVQAVRQVRVRDEQSLQALLQKTVKAGGEGLMLHRGASLYRAARNDDLLKLKLHEDAEARVIAHLPGKGKHQGRLGALLVEMPDGQRFRLGTGFSDAQRTSPPAIGSWVTYRYRDKNRSGIPRFASFMRVREDIILPSR